MGLSMTEMERKDPFIRSIYEMYIAVEFPDLKRIVARDTDLSAHFGYS